MITLFTLKCSCGGSEMTLNSQMTVERYPEPNGVVGDLISDCEIFSLHG